MLLVGTVAKATLVESVGDLTGLGNLVLRNNGDTGKDHVEGGTISDAVAEGIILHFGGIIGPARRFVLMLGPVFLERVQLARVVALDGEGNGLGTKAGIRPKRTVGTGLLLAQILRRRDAPARMAPVLLADLVWTEGHLRAIGCSSSGSVDTLLAGEVPVLKGRAPLAATALRQPIGLGSLGIVGLERTLAYGVLGGGSQSRRAQP
mmetsp:Transcript_11777/g.33575  ORF Transcript_11777/g.33575 Transcript_11777/m.33575 type:complete len:206 (-) Transcript_11777:238-855(-)